jgi:hypothetical protein
MHRPVTLTFKGDYPVPLKDARVGIHVNFHKDKTPRFTARIGATRGVPRIPPLFAQCRDLVGKGASDAEAQLDLSLQIERRIVQEGIAEATQIEPEAREIQNPHLTLPSRPPAPSVETMARQTRFAPLSRRLP